MQKTKDEFDFEPFANTSEYLKVNTEIVRSWVDAIRKNSINSIDCVLDIATGAGTMVQLLFEQLPLHWKQCVVLCLDQSEEALKLAQHRLIKKVRNLQLVHSTVEEMTFPTGSIDLAIWGNGIHYLSEEAQKKSIRRIKKVLKPGGWFFFNTSFYDGSRPPETLPFYRAQVKKAVEILRTHGIQRNRMETRSEASKFLPKSYYEQLVEEASFGLIEAKEFTVHIYKNAWEHISSFRQYAAGALHGYAPQEAATAMKKAVLPALLHHGQMDELQFPYIPRNWLAISARVGS